MDVAWCLHTYISLQPTYIHTYIHTYVSVYVCTALVSTYTYVMSLQTICFFPLPQSGRLRDERGGKVDCFRLPPCMNFGSGIGRRGYMCPICRYGAETGVYIFCRSTVDHTYCRYECLVYIHMYPVQRRRGASYRLTPFTIAQSVYLFSRDSVPKCMHACYLQHLSVCVNGWVCGHVHTYILPYLPTAGTAISIPFRESPTAPTARTTLARRRFVDLPPWRPARDRVMSFLYVPSSTKVCLAAYPAARASDAPSRARFASQQQRSACCGYTYPFIYPSTLHLDGMPDIRPGFPRRKKIGTSPCVESMYVNLHLSGVSLRGLGRCVCAAVEESGHARHRRCVSFALRGGCACVRMHGWVAWVRSWVVHGGVISSARMEG